MVYKIHLYLLLMLLSSSSIVSPHSYKKIVACTAAGAGIGAIIGAAIGENTGLFVAAKRFNEHKGYTVIMEVMNHKLKILVKRCVIAGMIVGCWAGCLLGYWYATGV